MKIFLAGIMQGSHISAELHDQEYRARLKQILVKQIPHAEVYDPLADHVDSLNYSDDEARRVFMHHNRMCQETDLLVAFVPEASMGTAIEMWEAHTAGRTVVTISPLHRNWAVRFLSDVVFSDLSSFVAAVEDGSLWRRLRMSREP